jgi:hypothetical protein
MKRIASLFLLVSLFYNVLGYYLMFVYQEEQAWVSDIEKKTDLEFQVIELNASLYSFVEDTDFEYVNENVIIENKSYHIFKKRIQNNILSLYYLRNSYGDVIGKNLNDIVDNQLFNSIPSKDSPVKKLLKSFLKDYLSNTALALDYCPNLDLDLCQHTTAPNLAINAGYLHLLYAPPKFI